MNGNNIQLIRAIVCAGLYPNVTVAPPSLCPPFRNGKSGKGGGGGGTAAASTKQGNMAPGGGGGAKGAGADKTAGEVCFQGSKGSMYLHPMAVNFDKKELDSRYGVYHEMVKTSKVCSTSVERWEGDGGQGTGGDGAQLTFRHIYIYIYVANGRCGTILKRVLSSYLILK